MGPELGLPRDIQGGTEGTLHGTATQWRSVEAVSDPPPSVNAEGEGPSPKEKSIPGSLRLKCW